MGLRGDLRVDRGTALLLLKTKFPQIRIVSFPLFPLALITTFWPVFVLSVDSPGLEHN